MSAVWQERLGGAWESLAERPAQARSYRTLSLAPACPMDAYAGLRAIDNAPCLLIRCEAPEELLFESNGLRLYIDHDEQGALLALALEDPAQRDLFTQLCADAVDTAGSDASLALGRFHARLNSWRSFLRERRNGLSIEETVGLIGELLVLERLLALHPGLLANWLAPDPALHDFVKAGHGLEIKTSRGPSSRLHISSLDQLDDSGLRRLDLVSVRLFDDPEGRTISDILAALKALLPDETARQTLDNAVLRRGLKPDDEHARSGLRISLRSLDAYTVDDRFPRLLRNQVPLAISDASYALERRALDEFAAEADSCFSLFAAGSAA